MLLKKLTAVGNRIPAHIFILQHHSTAYVLSPSVANLSTDHQRADTFLIEEKQLILGMKKSNFTFIPVSFKCYFIF